MSLTAYGRMFIFTVLDHKIPRESSRCDNAHLSSTAIMGRGDSSARHPLLPPTNARYPNRRLVFSLLQQNMSTHRSLGLSIRPQSQRQPKPRQPPEESGSILGHATLRKLLSLDTCAHARLHLSRVDSLVEALIHCDAQRVLPIKALDEMMDAADFADMTISLMNKKGVLPHSVTSFPFAAALLWMVRRFGKK